MSAVDVALLGATGFTGGLTADYLGAHLPADARWAVAGRSREKLLAVARRIESTGGVRPEIIDADATDEASLAALAHQTRVLASAVGPYVEHGLPVARAAAECGITYLDLAAEPLFVDRVWLELHEVARATGARLIHAAGFDCVPFDLGALYTVNQLPDDVPITVKAYLRARIVPSAGTIRSVLGVVGQWPAARRAAAQRRALEAGPAGRRVRGGATLGRAVGGGWGVPLPTLEASIVLRSARELDTFGPDFSYQHFLRVGSTPVLAGLAIGGAAALAALQLPPVRALVRRFARPGTGPSDAARAKSWVTVDFFAEAAGTQSHTRVSGRDPGYGGAAAILAESAMCAAFDTVPETSGQVTTAVAFGQKLIDRLNPQILRFEM